MTVGCQQQVDGWSFLPILSNPSVHIVKAIVLDYSPFCCDIVFLLTDTAGRNRSAAAHIDKYQKDETVVCERWRISSLAFATVV